MHLSTLAPEIESFAPTVSVFVNSGESKGESVLRAFPMFVHLGCRACFWVYPPPTPKSESIQPTFSLFVHTSSESESIRPAVSVLVHSCTRK